MNHEVAMPTASTGLGRRSLLGAAIGASAAVAVGERALAARQPSTVPPTEPAAPPSAEITEDDVELLGIAQTFELAALHLYDIALGLDWSSSPNEATVVATFRDSHEAYARAVSAELGRQAPNTADEALIADREAAFSNVASAPQAMYELEADLVATHTEVAGALTSTRAAGLVASILIVEARHGTVLADMLGSTDIEELLVDAGGSVLTAEKES